MKIPSLSTEPAYDLAPDGVPSPAPSRAARRAQRHLVLAERRFARTDLAVVRAVEAVRDAENALTELCDNAVMAETIVGGHIVDRAVVPDVLAMAQHDLRIAVRRRSDAASRVRRCRRALEPEAHPVLF